MHAAHTTGSVRFAPIVALDGGEPARAAPFAVEVAGPREARTRVDCAVSELVRARRERPTLRPTAVMVSLTQPELDDLDLDGITARLDASRVEPELLMVRVPHYVASAPTPTLELVAAAGLTVVVANLVVRSGELGLLAGAPIDMIELPPALVDDVDRTVEGAERIETWTAIAHRVDWLVLARNVRRPTQAQALQRLSCDLAAGPLMGAPREPAGLVPDAHGRGSRLAG